MKFSDISYKRPDFLGVIELIERETQAMGDAKTVEDGVECFNRVDDAMASLSDMETLVTVRYTQNTKDQFYSAERQVFAENTPTIREKYTVLQRVMLKSPLRPQLEDKLGKILFVNAEIDSRGISPQVLPLLEEEEKLTMEYQKLQSSIMVEFRGQRLPMSKMGFYTTDFNRDTRRQAVEANGRALAEHSDEYDDIFDKLVKVRTEIAKKLGLNSFTELGYMRMRRNCYGPSQVSTFRNEVKRLIVPLVEKLKKAQAERLELNELKFYDESVLSLKGNPRPICTDDALYQVGVEMYRDMRPETRDMIEKMSSGGYFDLLSREGKMTGGYCCHFIKEKTPYIFANFDGTAGDVEVFTHEGGHALAAYLARDVKPTELAAPTYEACEVHSMSMEFLCWPYLDRFYGDRSNEAKVTHLITSLYFIPYGCLVDEFQHEIYANPSLSPVERNNLWLELEKQYFPDMDYDNLTFYAQGRRWQRQLHIYEMPFYYIDYCLAQTCALQTMSNVINNGWDNAWEKYMAYTAQGGAGTFVEMLEKSGYRSPFVKDAIAEIVATAERVIDENKNAI